MKSLAGLRPSSYQLVPLTKLLLNGQNALLICDGVGVGKTISAGYILTYLSSLLERAGLVVCPPSLQDKWRFELRSKFSSLVIPVRSPEELDTVSEVWNDTSSDARRVYVMPFSLLARGSIPPFLGPVVIDEIHNYRNPETNLWRAASEMVRQASHRVGLSATPINNQLLDLAAEFALLLRTNRHVTEAIVADLWRPERRQLLYPMMTRFSKEYLGLHFATRQISDVRIQYPEQYEREVRATIKELRERPLNEVIFRDEVTYFRLAASSPRAFEDSTGTATSRPTEKVGRLLKILLDHRDEQIIVFCEFEETARELVGSVTDRPSFLMTGSVPMFDREYAVEQFRSSENGVMVMTSVGAEGLDLQSCSTLINFDLTWNPMVLEQRIGRIDRIGQTKPVVTVYNFLVDGSIDERIIHILGRKLGLLQGSLLQPASVLANSAATRGTLSAAGDLEKELSSARTVARALELSSSIIPDDYAVLRYIDESYCSVPALTKSSQRAGGCEWLVESDTVDKWRRQVKSASGELAQLVKFYST